MPSSNWRGVRVPNPRTRTSTELKVSFGCRPRHGGSPLQSQTRQPTIGRLVDDAMTAIERDNSMLKDVLPKGLTPDLPWTRPAWGR